MCSVFQRYNLKAIHNTWREALMEYPNVLSISKIQSKSNSQRGRYSEVAASKCAQYFKDTI